MGPGLFIVVEDDPVGDALADLCEWLREDVRQVRVEPIVRPVGPGEMHGGVWQALETAMLSKEVFGMVITGIGGWLSARATTRRTKIRVKRGDAEVEIDTANVREALAIADQLERRLSS
jgi:Effector Associated Constant Component 1